MWFYQLFYLLAAPVNGEEPRRAKKPLLAAPAVALAKAGAPSVARTRDPLIKSQLLYQLS